MKSNRVAILVPPGTNEGLYPSDTLLVGFRKLGLESAVFIKSEEIAAFQPDFVLALGHREPKLTQWPTYGVLSEGWLRYQNTRSLRNILSFDAYFTGVDKVREWLEDVTFGARKLAAPVGFLLPTLPATSWVQRTAPITSIAFAEDEEASDKLKDLVELLIRRPYFRRFVPGQGDRSAARGEHRNSSVAVFLDHGAGLFLQGANAFGDGVVSGRLFEILAAGAVAICSRNPFIERWFGNSVLYVDQDAPPQVQAWQIDKHMRWLSANPEAAQDLARQAHGIFVEKLALENLLPGVLELHEEVSHKKGYRPRAPLPGEPPHPSIAYILRTHGHPQRALESLRRQNYPQMEVFLVPLDEIPDLPDIATEFADLKLRVLDSCGAGPCSALWMALGKLRQAGFELFGVLEDADELFPNHVSTLLRTLQYYSGRSWFGRIGVTFSGCVEHAAEHFTSDRITLRGEPPGSRKLRIRHFRFYHPYLLDSQSHACYGASFLAGTELLDEEILTDPELHEEEIPYLQLLLAEKTLFAFSCEVTSAVHDQPEMPDPERHVHALEGDKRRVFFRTLGRSFPASSMYLHNVIFMTKFDYDLMAPVICAENVEKRLLVGTHPLQALGGAQWDGEVLKIPNRHGTGACIPALRLPSGGYRLRCFVNLPEPLDPDCPLFSMELDGGPAAPPVQVSARLLEPAGDARVATLEFEISRRNAGSLMEFHLLALGGGAFELLGTQLFRTALISSCSLQDLSPERTLWLYGAGEGGKIMKKKLDLVGLNATGFIDKHKAGTLDGLPIIDLDTAGRVLDESCTLLIASQFWQEIREDLALKGIRANLYSAFPYHGDVIYELY